MGEEKSLTSLYKDGVSYFEAGSYRQALEHFAVWLKTDPLRYQAGSEEYVTYYNSVHYTALCHFHLGDFQKAIEGFHWLTRIFRRNHTFFIELAFIYHESDDTQQSISVLEEFLNQNPPNADIHYALAFYNAFVGNIEKSRFHSEVLSSEQPELLGARYSAIPKLVSSDIENMDWISAFRWHCRLLDSKHEELLQTSTEYQTTLAKHISEHPIIDFMLWTLDRLNHGKEGEFHISARTEQGAKQASEILNNNENFPLKAWYELGRFYLVNGDLETALTFFRRAFISELDVSVSIENDPDLVQLRNQPNLLSSFNPVDMQIQASHAGATRRVHALAYSPDGSMIITAGDDSTVRLWTEHGKLLRIFTAHTAAVQALAFSLMESTSFQPGMISLFIFGA